MNEHDLQETHVYATIHGGRKISVATLEEVRGFIQQLKNLSTQYEDLKKSWSYLHMESAKFSNLQTYCGVNVAHVGNMGNFGQSFTKVQHMQLDLHS
ncbi:MAG: hypothetical protein Q3961_04100, partial [Bifidobacteriaceae bacterium]|nr:hypothetical protein [Bifidobacteriaceae bacterium]